MIRPRVLVTGVAGFIGSHPGRALWSTPKPERLGSVCRKAAMSVYDRFFALGYAPGPALAPRRNLSSWLVSMAQAPRRMAVRTDRQLLKLREKPEQL
jgi:hypothetical protein